MRHRLLIASVTVLVLNDFVLKARFPGVVTGKLSDVAGLVAFVLFWRALLPRSSAAVGVITALGFTWWKSPLAQPAIDAWNTLGILHVGRVVDVTDLLCLAVVPLACSVPLRAPERPRRWASLAVGALSLAAFVATSRPYSICCEDSYSLPDATVADAITHVKKLGLNVYESNGYATGRPFWSVDLRGHVCGRSTPHAVLRLKEADGRVRMHVYVQIPCREHAFGSEVQEMLRRDLLDPLGAQPAPSSGPK